LLDFPNKQIKDKTTNTPQTLYVIIDAVCDSKQYGINEAIASTLTTSSPIKIITTDRVKTISEKINNPKPLKNLILLSP
jgi:hypothetical protein